MRPVRSLDMGFWPPCRSSSNSTFTRSESPFLRRISRPWPPSFEQPSPTVKWKPSISHQIMDSIGRFEHTLPCRSISSYTTPRIHQTLRDNCRVGGTAFRTHVHGSHRVHGELIDRYKTNDHTQPALFCVFTPGLEVSQLFYVYICGHQCRRRTAQTGRASFVSNSVNLFLFSVPTTGNVVTHFLPLLRSCELSTLRVFVALSFAFAFLCPLLLVLALVLALDPATFHRDQPELCSTRSEIPVLILDKLDMRATRSVVRATTPEYDLKTNLNSVEFPLRFRGLPSANVFPDTTIHGQILLFRPAIRIKTTAPLPCAKKWIVMTWQEQCFREPWAVRRTVRSRHVRRTRKSDHKDRNYSQLKKKVRSPQERRGTLNKRQPRDQKQHAHSPLCVVLKTYHSSTCSHKRMLETLISSTLTEWENGMIQLLFTWNPSPLRSSTTLTGTCRAASERLKS